VKLPKYTQVSTQNTQKTKLQKSRKQEDKLAKKFSGRTVAGSGNGKFVKGDVNLREAKIEAKRTDAPGSISLKREWLKKLEVQAMNERKFPVLAIQFANDNEQYYVIRQSEFNDYLSYLRENPFFS
jgi:hypothetical protein